MLWRRSTTMWQVGRGEGGGCALLQCLEGVVASLHMAAGHPILGTPCTALPRSICSSSLLLPPAAFGERFYNACKDVVYPVMNQKAMAFVGG